RSAAIVPDQRRPASFAGISDENRTEGCAGLGHDDLYGRAIRVRDRGLARGVGSRVPDPGAGALGSGDHLPWLGANAHRRRLEQYGVRLEIQKGPDHAVRNKVETCEPRGPPWGTEEYQLDPKDVAGCF